MRDRGRPTRSLPAHFSAFLNNNIPEYQLPASGDVRNFEVDFIDEPDPQLNSLGAKGVGEVAAVGAAARSPTRSSMRP